MKKFYTLITVLLLIIMLTVPTISMKNEKTIKSVNASPKTSQSSDEDKVIVLQKDENKCIKISITEYLTGVLAGEISPEYEEEAIKAQIVAAYSLMLYRSDEYANEEYDITDDYTTDQNYLTYAERKEKWNENFETNEKKISLLIADVYKQHITYNGKNALCVYHAVSGGRTESAENIWGGEYPYLVPVESVADMLASDFVSTVTYTTEEFKSLCKSSEIALDGEYESYFSEIETTDSGTVKTMKICNTEYSGQEIRSAFGLRSANFDISFDDGKFVFTVRGYGHGVGMSQYGANEMAKEGADYKEILLWYYSNCEITG